MSLTYAQGLTRLWGGSPKPFSVYLLHTWTLAIEEQFYLVWPALLLMVGSRRVAILALVCAGGSMLARSQGVWWDSLTRADGLCLGGLLAALRFPDEAPVRRLWSTRLALPAIRLAGLGAMALLGVLGARKGLRPEGALSSYPVLTLLLVNVLWLGLIEVVLSGAGRPSLGLLRLRPLRRLGVISYGLYLYHLPVLMITLDVARGLGVPGKPSYVRILGVLLAVPLAALSWRFIERPLLDLKRRYSYSPGANDALAPPGHHHSESRWPASRETPAGDEATAIVSDSTR